MGAEGEDKGVSGLVRERTQGSLGENGGKSWQKGLAPGPFPHFFFFFIIPPFSLLRLTPAL